MKRNEIINVKTSSYPLLPQMTVDTKLDQVFIGKSKYTDDNWDLSPFTGTLARTPGENVIRFGPIGNEEMKKVLKQYAYVRLGEVKPITVIHDINCSFPLFRKFSKENFITNFTEITLKVFKSYSSSWLTTKWESGQISASYAYDASRLVEDVVTKGQIKGWKVSGAYINGMSSKIWNKRVKHEMKENKRQPVPPLVLDQIINAVKNHETNLFVKSVIIVLSQTGLRIGDVLSLKVGCIGQDKKGNWILDVWIQKGDQEAEARVNHQIIVNEWAAQTIKEYERCTLILRSRLKKELQQRIALIRSSNLSKPEQDAQINELQRTDISNHLFIHTSFGNNPETNTIFLTGVRSWGRWIKKFMNKWEIVGEDGEIYPIDTHQFRHTFVSELIKQDVKPAFIQKYLAHVSEEMVAYYTSINDDHAKKELAMKFLHPDAKTAGKRAEEIMEQTAPLFRGKTAVEIEGIIEELAEELSFNLLPTGICLFDEVRGQCTNGNGCFFYNCANYLTTEEKYPVLKKELDECEKWMARFKIDGKKRDYDRLFIVWEHLKPLVDELEAKINGKKH